MAEPHSTAIGAATGAIAALPAMFLGAHVDALILGLMASIFISIWLPSVDDRAKAFSAVCLSSLLAGYGAPIAAAYAATQLPTVATQADQARLFLAVLIGIVSPALVPTLIGKLTKRAEGL